MANLTIEAMREWASGHPEGSVLGHARVECECPVAEWLHSGSYPRWRVGYVDGTTNKAMAYLPGAVIVGRGLNFLPLPPWCAHLMRLVDSLPIGSPITREVLLRFLDAVQAKEENNGPLQG